ncbi:MAG: hypothetical protein AAFV97_03405 [Bacteroidota bacterium]
MDENDQELGSLLEEMAQGKDSWLLLWRGQVQVLGLAPTQGERWVLDTEEARGQEQGLDGTQQTGVFSRHPVTLGVH